MLFDIDAIRQANTSAGKFFFSTSTIGFFRSRIGRRVYNGPAAVTFVTSEQMDDDHERLYTVRRFDPETCGIDTIGPHCEFSQTEAHKVARLFAAGQIAPRGEDEDFRAFEARVRDVVSS
jgi:hypothetical protein